MRYGLRMLLAIRCLTNSVIDSGSLVVDAASATASRIVTRSRMDTCSLKRF
ncbi:MAG: hypothetical protein A4E63_02274 [Syntrophorhabdus sp. PtaU1.Bin050]|nr:MAG: hypothetical protein A4E63_02274 [Syntrophorhabdus sp. PtaU1.Bin050]